jgi:hypothetical protein
MGAMSLSTSVGRWTAVAIAVLVAGIIAVLVLDVTEGGEAKPGAPLGEAKGERYEYVAPTATPVGFRPEPTARPSVGAPVGVSGDPASRDATRRDDLLKLVAAAQAYREENGAFPFTNNNVQTVCAFENIDVGCELGEFLEGGIPSDPLRDPVKNGYWFQSDGQDAKFYAALEQEPPDGQECPTEDAELQKKNNLVCIEA